MPILKIFAEGEDAAKLVQQASVLQAYDTFVVIEANDKEAADLAERYPVEDISAQYLLSLGGREIDTLAWRAPNKKNQLKKKLASTGLPEGPHHYVVQFIGPIKPSWTRGIRRLGVKLREHFKDFSYVAWIPQDKLEQVMALDYVLWVGHLPHQDRLSPELGATPAAAKAARGESAEKPALPRRRVRPNVFSVEVFDPADVKRIAQSAKELGFNVLLRDSKVHTVLVESEQAPAARKKQLKDLAAVHGVRYVRERAIPRTANNVATGVMGNPGNGASSAGFNLAGEGEIVAVCDTGLDTGDPASIHPDFTGRIVAIKSYPITSDWNSVIFNGGANDGPSDLDSGHGTHVTGSVLGDGAASGAALIRGHAHKAKLVFQAIEQEMKWRPNAPPKLKAERYVLSGIPPNLGPLFRFAYDQGARVHSNSWGGGDPGAYDDQCRQFDQFVWDNKDFCFVIAAGNDGTDLDGDGQINLGSVTSPGTAKNCITVGACENKRPEFNSDTYGEWWPQDFPVDPPNTDPMADDPDQVVAFSSRGPTADGRIKPDVIAPGTFILSTRSTRIAPNNFAWKAYPPSKKYFFMGGTSMATPLTSGAVALVREFLRTEQNIDAPSAALVKALLIAGAQRLPGTGAPGATGDNHQGYGRVNLARSFGAVLETIEGQALDTGEKASFTLSVPQTNKALRIVLAYTDAPGEALVNNLNLMVVDPSGKRWVGNQSSNGTVLKLDSKNNVEVVHRAKAKKGQWRIDVLASNVSQGPQDFAIAAVLV